MKKYNVEIIETLQKIVSIEADNENEAYKKVSEIYKCGKIILTADDCFDKEINVLE